MSVVFIVGKNGACGWQARVGTSCAPGKTRYFACDKHGWAEAEQLARKAERELQRAHTTPAHWRTRRANERRRA